MTPSDQEVAPGISDAPEILFHLRWVARVALWVGLVAAAGLCALLYTFSLDASNYAEWIRNQSVVQHQLGPALLIGGFFLLAFAAFLTWLIVLYSSFRIAGPLFRLFKNLETSIQHGPSKPVPIRATDALRHEAALLEEAVQTLATHYNAIRDEVDQVLHQLDNGAVQQGQRIAMVERLTQRLKHARF